MTLKEDQIAFLKKTNEEIALIRLKNKDTCDHLWEHFSDVTYEFENSTKCEEIVYCPYCCMFKFIDKPTKSVDIGNKLVDKPVQAKESNYWKEVFNGIPKER